MQNQTSAHKQDGVTVLRVFNTILENLPGKIDFALENLVGILLAEILTAT